MFFLSIGQLHAQKDMEHWIAPYFASTTGYTHGLYFSTDSVTPFTVDIYNNNTIINTVTISKGNPATYIMTTAQANQYLFANADADALTVKTRGIYTKGTKPYFLSLRMYQSAHGEILTSKGKAGTGNVFYAAPAPITGTSSAMNFTTGILATEDNTSVTVSSYDANIRFVNGPTSNTPTSYTFTLQKGESVLFAGEANIVANRTGFIGAKIESTKPITVTNGNANGMFGTTNTTSGSDLIMDQSVPVDKLGSTFAMIRSLTYLGDTANMEGGIIVATENNTQIFLNGSPTAIATINEGEFYRILSNNYINAAGTHYNMFIATSKNAYLYQLLGTGDDSSGTNTGGFNYIPPLNCYLPRKIDEIGNVHLMPNSTYTNTMKLNIVTEAGANVQAMNGTTPLTLLGPFSLAGSTNWVTYEVPGVTGNLSVTSTKAVTAGVNGGYSTAGYGGYFAGFSSLPLITRNNQECIPGMVISVDDYFETYQWFFNGVAITGANTPSYTPTQPGVYTCTVSISGCAPVTTPPYEVFSCPVLTTVNVNVCNSKTFTPQFSASQQTIDLATITITTPPTNGTAAVDPTTGVISYTPNPGYIGLDTFVYSFNSTVPTFFDSEIVTVNVNNVLLETYEDTLTSCPYNGVALYDLTTADVTAFTPPFTKKYYHSLLDAQNGTNEIVNPTLYTSANGFAYVKVTTPEGCTDYAKINLEFYPVPTVTDATISSCFIELNPTTASFDLETANVSNDAGITKIYYPSLTDAQNGTNAIVNYNTYISTSTDVYVRVISPDMCYSIAKITLDVIEPVYSLVLKDKVICVEDKTTLDAGPGFESYLWSTGATTQSISNVSVGEYSVILTTEGCPTLQKVKVIKSPSPIITDVDINNNTVTVNVTGGTPPYQYSLDGINWQESNVFPNLQRGENTFYVIDTYDCDPITIDVTVPNLVNAITANNDGINDYIDYSALAYKKDLKFSIYDRYGNQVSLGDKKNNYRWDGRFNDKKVYTGTYWYQINWTENNAEETKVKYTGWILVKNRE